MSTVYYLADPPPGRAPPPGGRRRSPSESRRHHLAGGASVTPAASGTAAAAKGSSGPPSWSTSSSGMPSSNSLEAGSPGKGPYYYYHPGAHHFHPLQQQAARQVPPPRGPSGHQIPVQSFLSQKRSDRPQGGPVNHQGHRGADVNRPVEAPHVPVDPDQDYLTTKKVEVKRTKNTERRVQRQLVLEDGRVLHDEPAHVIVDTVEDIETHETNHIEDQAVLDELRTVMDKSYQEMAKKRHDNDSKDDEHDVVLQRDGPPQPQRQQQREQRRPDHLQQRHLPEGTVVSDTFKRTVNTHDVNEKLTRTRVAQDVGLISRRAVNRLLRGDEDVKQVLLSAVGGPRDGGGFGGGSSMASMTLDRRRRPHNHHNVTHHHQAELQQGNHQVPFRGATMSRVNAKRVGQPGQGRSSSASAGQFVIPLRATEGKVAGRPRTHVYEASSHRRTIDTEDVHNVSRRDRDGKVTSETVRTEKHEVYDDKEAPDDDDDGGSSGRSGVKGLERVDHERGGSRQRYRHDKTERAVDYYRVGQDGVARLVCQGPKVVTEDREVQLPPPDESTLRQEELLRLVASNHEVRRAKRIDQPQHEQGQQPAAAVDNRKDALTRQPLNLHAEEKTRRKETDMWLERHFGGSEWSLSLPPQLLLLTQSSKTTSGQDVQHLGARSTRSGLLHRYQHRNPHLRQAQHQGPAYDYDDSKVRRTKSFSAIPVANGGGRVSRVIKQTTTTYKPGADKVVFSSVTKNVVSPQGSLVTAAPAAGEDRRGRFGHQHHHQHYEAQAVPKANMRAYNSAHNLPTAHTRGDDDDRQATPKTREVPIFLVNDDGYEDDRGRPEGDDYRRRVRSASRNLDHEGHRQQHHFYDHNPPPVHHRSATDLQARTTTSENYHHHWAAASSHDRRHRHRHQREENEVQLESGHQVRQGRALPSTTTTRQQLNYERVQSAPDTMRGVQRHNEVMTDSEADSRGTVAENPRAVRGATFRSSDNKTLYRHQEGHYRAASSVRAVGGDNGSGVGKAKTGQQESSRAATAIRRSESTRMIHVNDAASTSTVQRSREPLYLTELPRNTLYPSSPPIKGPSGTEFDNDEVGINNDFSSNHSKTAHNYYHHHHHERRRTRKSFDLPVVGRFTKSFHDLSTDYDSGSRDFLGSPPPPPGDFMDPLMPKGYEDLRDSERAEGTVTNQGGVHLRARSSGGAANLRRKALERSAYAVHTLDSGVKRRHHQAASPRKSPPVQQQEGSVSVTTDLEHQHYLDDFRSNKRHSYHSLHSTQGLDPPSFAKDVSAGYGFAKSMALLDNLEPGDDGRQYHAVGGWNPDFPGSLADRGNKRHHLSPSPSPGTGAAAGADTAECSYLHIEREIPMQSSSLEAQKFKTIIFLS